MVAQVEEVLQVLHEVLQPSPGPAFALSDGVLLRSADRPRGLGGGGPAGGPVDGSASGTDPEETFGDGNSSLELSGPAFAAAALASALAPLRRVVFGAMLPRVCRGTLTGGSAILGAAAKRSVCTAVSQSCCFTADLEPTCMAKNTGSRP